MTTKSSPIRRFLGAPALHVLSGALFFFAFVWPMFAVDRPAKTFYFLHAAWALSLVVLFFVSRGDDAPGARDDEEEEPDASESTSESAAE